MSKIALVIADGSEEMEIVIIADVLRRADLDVDLVSILGEKVLCSRKVSLCADRTLDSAELSDYDVIILPGGMDGTQSFIRHEPLLGALQSHHSEGKLLCAICAAPLALDSAGILKGRAVTCHPSVSDRVTSANYTGKRVERDGNILTSQGPGTAFEFALEIIAELKGHDAAQSVRSGLVL